MTTPKLYVDMDGTTAEWRAAAAFEDLFEEGYFSSLRPYQNVVDAVKLIIRERPDITVCILTAYFEESRYALNEKRDWLTKHLPEIKEQNRHYTLCDITKPMAVSGGTNVLLPTDFLLDDFSKNLHEWVAAGGTGIKLRNGINGNNGTWKGHSVSRMLPPEEIAKYIIEIIDKAKEG